MADDLHGKDYRAVHRLSNGDDTVEYAAIGETCERVPIESLAGLLTHGYIAPVRPPTSPIDDAAAAAEATQERNAGVA